MRRAKLTDWIMKPFMVCVRFLLWLGKLCRLSYVQISVIFNLWLQGGLVVLSGVAPAVAAVWKLKNYYSTNWLLVTLLLFGYAIIYVLAYIKMLRHYRLPYQRAFDQCVNDLILWAEKLRTTYEMVNLLFFVLFFLVVLVLNILLTYCILIA